MNRHIYGLTLFLIIVKIHFLIYWAFFAPINFVSTIEVPIDHVSPVEYKTSSKCNRSKERRAVLQNAAVDFENMKVSANVRFSDLGTAFEANEFGAYLRFFNDEINEFIYLKPNYSAEASNVVAFQGKLPNNGKWNRKSNYYAQLHFEHGEVPRTKKHIFTDVQPVPVLIITDKHR